MAAGEPIFVVGFQRSGTTLLQGLLGAHPRIAAPPELHFILRVAYFADLFGDLADDSNLRHALHEALNPPVDILAECGFDEDALFEKARTGPRTYAALFATIMDDYAERTGKPRWAEKTPSQRPDDIYNLFPDAQVIHIVRDPREVVASNVDMPWEHRSPAAIARDLADFTFETLERGRRAGDARYLQVRYEDLAENPEATLRRICAFVGEDYDAGMLDPGRRGAALMPGADWQAGAARAITPARSKWRERLGPLDRLRVETITRHLIEPFGYSPLSSATRAAMPLMRAEAAARRRVAAARARRKRPRTAEERYAAVRALMQVAADSTRQ